MFTNLKKKIYYLADDLVHDVFISDQFYHRD